MIIEYPRPGIYSPGFLTGSAPTEVADKTGQKLLSVFIPTVPNPATGFLVFVPEDQVTILEMGVDDGIKFIITAGVIKPS